MVLKEQKKKLPVEVHDNKHLSSPDLLTSHPLTEPAECQLCQAFGNEISLGARSAVWDISQAITL